MYGVAESEVISMIGEGRSREDIAAGVVHSVAEKVAQLARRKQLPGTVILTGGLSECPYLQRFSRRNWNVMSVL